MNIRNLTIPAPTLLALALTANQSLAQSIYEPYTFTTLAGLAGSHSAEDGTGSSARFYYPWAVAVDRAGNVYVGDLYNGTVRKVSTSGVVTTLAGLAGSFGSADGTGGAARFNAPGSVAVDSADNVYVADWGNYTIRKVTSAGVVTTLAGLAGISGSADGAGSDARFGLEPGVAVDSTGNVYVADTDNHTIRKVTPSGIVTTLAGLAGKTGGTDGTGSDARFYGPYGLAVDSTDGVYVADGYETIRKMTPSGVVTTLATLNCVRGIRGLGVDSAGNVYVAHTACNTIEKVTPSGEVTTVAGLANGRGSADGTGSAARFVIPQGVAVDTAGNVYVADTGNHTIRKGYPALTITASGPNFGSNGAKFGFNLTGPAGQIVIIEASTDLVSWLPLWTNTFAGALHFNDSQSGVSSSRFYRAHTP